jgi:hypothetical protein
VNPNSVTYLTLAEGLSFCWPSLVRPAQYITFYTVLVDPFQDRARPRWRRQTWNNELGRFNYRLCRATGLKLEFSSSWPVGSGGDLGVSDDALLQLDRQEHYHTWGALLGDKLSYMPGIDVHAAQYLI